MPPLVWNFILTTGGALYEPPLCKGRCRALRGGGVVPDTNYLLFLLCNLHTFTIPQALSRQLPLHKGAFGLCEHCKQTCGASCACGVVRQPPTGFVQISERGTLSSVGEDSISSRLT